MPITAMAEKIQYAMPLGFLILIRDTKRIAVRSITQSNIIVVGHSGINLEISHSAGKTTAAEVTGRPV